MNKHLRPEIPDNNTALGTQCLYIMTTDEGFPCKVGITEKPSLRLRNIQGGNWNKIHASAFFFPYKIGPNNVDVRTPRLNTVRKSAAKMEWLVHNKMKEMDLHIRGEWFGICSADAISVCQKVADINGYRLILPKDMVAIDPSKLSRRSDGEAAVALLEISIDALAVLNRVD